MSPKFTENELRRLGYKKGSDGTWGKKHIPHQNRASPSDPEPNPQCPPPNITPLEGRVLPRLVAIIRIFTVRDRDHDNLSAKWYIDALVHLGVMEDDTAEHIEVVFSSEKVKSFAEERTEIELFEL